MCCLLFEIKNNTKIFFDELKVKFEIEGMQQLNNQLTYLIDNIAGQATRRLKICFYKRDFKPVHWFTKISAKNIANMNSENNKLKLIKLDSLAATRDIFEKKVLSLVWDMKISPFKFATPLQFSDVPNLTIKTFEDRLIFSSHIYDVIYDQSDNRLIDLDRFTKVREVSNLIIVIDTKLKQIYVKDNIVE